MPELPEVEFCGRALARWTLGRRIIQAEVLDSRSVRASRVSRPSDGHPTGTSALRHVVLGRAPEPPVRHGKRLYWGFGDQGLLLHLGMTGKWTRRETPFGKVRLQVEGGDWITFSDPRLLGGVVPCTRDGGLHSLRQGLGPDALLDPLPPLRGKRAVKLVLMDQSVVAGLGNLHAAEALWRSKLDPRLPADAISPLQHARLARSVRRQLQDEIKAFDNEDEIVYVEDAGAANPFPVYGQLGKPCPACRAPIERFEQGGRSTYWCPSCQSGRAIEQGPTQRATTSRPGHG